MPPRGAVRRRALRALAVAALAACAGADGSAVADASASSDATLLYSPVVQMPTQVRHCALRRRIALRLPRGDCEHALKIPPRFALLQSLVLRANRAAYTRHLEPEYVCTSLSGAWLLSRRRRHTPRNPLPELR